MQGFDSDRMMVDLKRLVNANKIQTEEELKRFMQSIIGKKLPEVPPANDAERAEDLVSKAYAAPSDEKARQLARQALELDPDCIPAYELLANTTLHFGGVRKNLETACAIGRRKFLGDNLEEYLDQFWGRIETRPWMRAEAALAEIEYAEGETRQAMARLKELVDLNPHDNQGNRYRLMIWLVETGHLHEYRRYFTAYGDEQSALTAFTFLLATFKLHGPGEAADDALKEAQEANAHVVPLLLRKNPPKEMPPYYKHGDVSEAKMAAMELHYAWHETLGAVEWLKGKSVKAAPQSKLRGRPKKG